MAKKTLTLPVLNLKGEKKGQIRLPEEIFGQKINVSLISQAVRVYLANQRQGGSSTKTRGEVKGSGRKIYRQKGTGRARHGDRYAPIFVGGGIAHGPKPKDWSLKMSKNMRKKALFSSLSAKLQDDSIIIVEELEKLKTKTQALVKTLPNLKIETKNGKIREKVLLATAQKLENVYLSSRNVKNLKVIPADILNTYEIMNAKKIIMAKDSVDVLKKNYLK